MIDLLSRVTQIEEILSGSFTNKDKVIMALDKLSGLCLDDLTPKVLKIIESHLAAINVILGYYPVKVFDDYEKISEPHLNEITSVIKNMCRGIRSQTPDIFILSSQTSLH